MGENLDTGIDGKVQRDQNVERWNQMASQTLGKEFQVVNGTSEPYSFKVIDIIDISSPDSGDKARKYDFSDPASIFLMMGQKPRGFTLVADLIYADGEKRVRPISGIEFGQRIENGDFLEAKEEEKL